MWLRAGIMVPESRHDVAIMALPSSPAHEMPYQSGFEAPDKGANMFLSRRCEDRPQRCGLGASSGSPHLTMIVNRRTLPAALRRRKPRVGGTRLLP